MTEKAEAEVPLRDFPGLNLEMDEYDLSDGGSHDQVNAQSTDLGRMRSRSGFRVVTFEDD